MRDVNWVLRQAEADLMVSPEAEVRLGWRVRLWDAMSREYPHDALFRRGVLAYRVARKTLPAWDSIKDRVDERIRNVPPRLVENCRRYLRAEIGEDDARDYDFQNEVEYAGGL